MHFRQTFSDIYGPVGLTICCISVLSNVFNVVILSKRWLRRPTTTILIGVAAMDLSVSLSQIPLLIQFYLARSKISSDTNQTTSSIGNVSSNIWSTPGCGISRNGYPLLYHDRYDWRCHTTNGYGFISWGSAVFFLVAFAVTLTSHTCSMWFGAVLAVFRWWLISDLDRTMSEMRKALQTQSSRRIRPSVSQLITVPRDLSVTRVCVHCGRAFSVRSDKSSVTAHSKNEDGTRLNCNCIDEQLLQTKRGHYTSSIKDQSPSTSTSQRSKRKRNNHAARSLCLQLPDHGKNTPNGKVVSRSLKQRLRLHRHVTLLLTIVILLAIPSELPTAFILVLKRYTHFAFRRNWYDSPDEKHSQESLRWISLNMVVYVAKNYG
ncbi:hypothetical protein CLF_102418 [Clonorchis sinensis]|uniref:G-protein coupled receptors family 1 profile domain-containing protein n=1 Tax=Clonorchis sinensis TaxID=79923 RepID=G7Y7W2_CLOSI|nr:hypothetical protein CLF_102418 [Clonorchis sinensis]